MTIDEALATLSWIVLSLFWVCFVIVLFRNLLSLVQLAIAFWAFATRVRPSPSNLFLWQRYSDLAPPVSVIAPAFNEELSIAQSVRALRALEYPEHEVIVVNDGSKDQTLQKLIDEFGLKRVNREQLAVLQQTKILGAYASPRYPNLLVVDKENGRKADAANAGIGFARMPLVCVIDADSIIERDGLMRAAEPFMTDNGQLVAVGGAIRIANGCEVVGGSLAKIGIPRSLIPRFQVVEYLRAFLMARVANAELGMLMLISGAFGLFRRSAVVEVGGYRHDTVGEDLELVVRLHRHMREQGRAYRMAFIPEVVCWTEAPAELKGLRNQRARWQQGALETLIRHRVMIGNPRYGRIGLVAMPQLVIEDVLGPPSELIGYLLLPVAWSLGILAPDIAIAFLCVTFLFGTAITIATMALEETQLRRTPSARDLIRLGIAAVIENFGYRQANLVFRLVGIKRHFKKETGWSAVPRIGFGAK
jgi:cellulose synthase/poly-beta-1,6-N-acetylglucosamine synthase-like glycosyltransferase